MNFTDEELEELEAQYKEIDDKLIQIQILMELSTIRQLLQSEAQGESETETYTCKACKETVEASERTSHAVNSHKAFDTESISELYKKT